jgi:hypothetical protein
MNRLFVFAQLSKNPNNQDVGARAYLTSITKRDMADKFVACGFSDNLLLTFANESAAGPSNFSVVHEHVPKFLVSCSSESNRA